MLVLGGKHWVEQIAEVTGSVEFQTCVIEIVDPDEVTSSFSHTTGKYTDVVGDDAVVYSGQARLIGVRRGVNYEGSSQYNSKTITAIRVQLPHLAVSSRLRKGFSAKITSAPFNPALTSYSLTLASDVQGSSAASRTLEFNVDGDSDVS